MKATTEMKRSTGRVFLPGSVVGILGGGQLGRMVILEGRKMGYRFVTLDPAADCPAGQVADRHIAKGYDDPEGAEALAEAADVIAYEFENVSAEAVKRLERRAALPQGSRLLEVTQHRLREKESLAAGGLPVTPFRAVRNPEEAKRAAEELGLPCVMKTATGGYDGKGQRLIRSAEEAASSWTDLSAGGRELILEQFVPFQKELSVVVARGIRGETASFPVAENIHRDHILHRTIVPAPIDEGIARQAKKLARDAAEHLGVVGLIAVEMFLLEDGRLLINELAPRPHNSGHYTYDACATSQFEQFLRAICGLPLGSPRLLTPAVMVNVLGQHLPGLLEKLPYLPPEVKVHLYGKREARYGRKMGHVTVLADANEALEIIHQIGLWEK
ncbi:5-(carboxyamino)imidazole ribonucleotide synthase [Planifilum fimeticola]|uniref:N5-carboxyaminoimidazole ribonucleotide synthase n=2 Tax=Planifilum fimeticola TaxID=201975 RepID=A0A2T0LAU4_9BACL|nr:5-(carboxyamino)imidazole ribonucleotide synthase [Planifilum fimeticola]